MRQQLQELEAKEKEDIGQRTYNPMCPPPLLPPSSQQPIPIVPDKTTTTLNSQPLQVRK